MQILWILFSKDREIEVMLEGMYVQHTYIPIYGTMGTAEKKSLNKKEYIYFIIEIINWE